MTTIYDLPKPGHVALKRSRALSECIRQEIAKQHGVISFATFMELALYHPTLGFYNADTFTLGKHGDFTTAPEISPLFAKCFAKQIQQISNNLSSNNILELGAGTGRFANDLLSELDQNGCLPQHYYIYEISHGLRKKQQEFLRSACPHFFSRITWLDVLPVNFIGTIIANEVLDALPVHCFHIEDATVKERCIRIEKDEFTWQLEPPTTETLANEILKMRDHYALSSGYDSEINLYIHEFIPCIANALTQGIILFADYGYGQREYYHPERRQGTLTCFYQHRRHNNPLLLPGLQDITTHVDFTRVIEIAADTGCSLAGFTSQSAFLLACGLMNIAADEEKHLSPINEFRLHHAIKLLTMPTEMGERIKIMALSKNIELPLLGFHLQDRRRDL